MRVHYVGSDTGRNSFKQITNTTEGGVLLARQVFELTELQVCIDTRQAAHEKRSGAVEVFHSPFEQRPVEQRPLAEGVKRIGALKDRACALNVFVLLVSRSKTRPKYGIAGVQRDS